MEADVTRNIEEQLSAFLDGELPESELQLLVRRLEKDPAYRETLARYSLMGSILRNDPVVPPSEVFREKLMQAVDQSESAGDETEVSSAEGGQADNNRWLNYSAVAAVLVGVAVLGIYQDLPEPAAGAAGGPAQVAISSPSEATAADAGAYVQRVSQARARPVNPDRMTSYLVSHGEFSRSLQGTMVDSRIFVQQARFQE